MLRQSSRLLQAASRMVPDRPIIAVIGATGTGKSQLAVDIALKFNGEIINADAMQMYEGLPVITNKITAAEQQGVVHHLLGCVNINEPAWRVDKFVPRATQLIHSIHAQGKLPIVVGGTHYYVQKLLFDEGLATSHSKATNDMSKDDGEFDDLKYPILNAPTQEMYERLREVDPIMANRWHPNERRKIRRSLQLWLKTGTCASEIYAIQADSQHKNVLKWPTLFLWPHVDRDQLNERLDRRVGRMIDTGLLDEVFQMQNIRRQLQSDGQEVDDTSGIWVSIGYKEFKQYADAQEQARPKEILQKMRDQAIERTMTSTRQYAKSQLKWIRIKLINALREAGSSENIFIIDTVQLENWTDISQQASQATNAFLEGLPLTDVVSQSELAQQMLKPKQEYDLSHRPDLWKVERCELCGVSATTQKSWQDHLNSKGHRSVLRRRSKQVAESKKPP